MAPIFGGPEESPNGKKSVGLRIVIVVILAIVLGLIFLRFVV